MLLKLVVKRLDVAPEIALAALGISLEELKNQNEGVPGASLNHIGNVFIRDVLLGGAFAKNGFSSPALYPGLSR